MRKKWIITVAICILMCLSACQGKDEGKLAEKTPIPTSTDAKENLNGTGTPAPTVVETATPVPPMEVTSTPMPTATSTPAVTPKLTVEEILERRTYTNEEFAYTVLADDTIKILMYIKEYGENTVIIPSEIDGRIVTRIGSNVLFARKDISKVVLPDTIQYIEDSAFYESGLTEITIPDSVREIGSMAFYGCINLSNVELSDNVEIIEVGAFYRTQWLWDQTEPVIIGTHFIYAGEDDEIVHIPDGITSVDFYEVSSVGMVWLPDSLIHIGKQAFAGCHEMGMIILPETLKEIDEQAFYRCSSLQEIVLPDEIERIGDGAFAECSNLKECYFPDKAIQMGNMVFYDTLVLENAEIPMIIGTHYIFAGEEKDVVVPEGITSVDFFDCTEVETVDLPDSLTIIGKGAFAGASSLKHIIIPNGVTEIGEDAFSGAVSLETVILPDELKVIWHKAFYNNQNLNQIDIPETVSDMGSSVFEGCTNLQKVSLPEEIQILNYNTFYGCSSLKSINIPDSVIYIGAGVFNGCTNLKKVMLSDEVLIGASDSFGYHGMEIFVNAGTRTEEWLKNAGISYILNTTVNGSDTATDTDTSSDVSSSDVVSEGWETTLEDYILSCDGRLEVDGEWCNATAGESGILVWRYAEAGFNTPACYMTAYVSDPKHQGGNVINSATWKPERLTEWQSWYEYNRFDVRHVGEDVFQICDNYAEFDMILNCYYYNAGKDICFSEENAPWANDKFTRMTMFHDGVALGEYFEATESGWPTYERKLGMLHEEGFCIILDISLGSAFQYEKHSLPLGEYSDGVFYYDGAFYDADANAVLELPEDEFGTPYVRQGGYAPYFEDGECRLITYKNGKYWAFDIDKKGNMISEPEEVDPMWL